MHTEMPDKKHILLNLLKTAGILFSAILLEETLFFLGLPIQNLDMVYILAIILISRYTDGYIYGIGAAIGGTFIYDYLVTDPRRGFSFTIGFPITLIIMLTVSLISCAITNQMKAQTALAREREQRSKLMHEITQKLLAANNMAGIARIAANYLTSYFEECSVGFFAKTPAHENTFMLTYFSGSQEEEQVLHSASQQKVIEKIQNEQGCFPGNVIDSPPVYYIPIYSPGSVLGFLSVFSTSSTSDQMKISFVQMLVGQVALAMERQYAFDRQQSIRIDAEKEKMRGMLLRAISHDLRTPLTGIFTAGAVIREQAGTMRREEIGQLASDIKGNAEWLIRMVENLLAVTRISDGAVKVKKTTEVAEEVMAQAAAMVRKRFPDCNISVKTAEEPVLVRIDAILISQVLINLLENSVKFSPAGSPVELTLSYDEASVMFCVSDRGSGIPEQILAQLLDTNVSGIDGAVDSRSGMGIGLLICKAIVTAHDGRITGSNRPEGGSTCVVTLPIDGGRD